MLKTIFENFESLDSRSLGVFSACCCEHGYPTFEYFMSILGQSDKVQTVRRVLDLTWEYYAENSPVFEELKRFEEEVAEIMTMDDQDEYINSDNNRPYLWLLAGYPLNFQIAIGSMLFHISIREGKVSDNRPFGLYSGCEIVRSLVDACAVRLRLTGLTPSNSPSDDQIAQGVPFPGYEECMEEYSAQKHILEDLHSFGIRDLNQIKNEAKNRGLILVDRFRSII